MTSDEENGTEEDTTLVVSSSERPTEESGVGWFLASMLIVNSALGGGLLNFPSAFHEAGMLTAACVQAFLILFIVPALLILAYCSDYNNSDTMQKTLQFTWGKAGQRLTSWCMIFYCFGTSITYFIIIGDQLDQVFSVIAGDTFCHYWYMHRSFTMVATSILFILPMCYPKRIDCLKHASSVGVVAIVYVVLLIIAQYYTGDYTPGNVKSNPDEWTDIFLVIPTICFGYQCHVGIIPIYSCMKKRSVKNFTGPVLFAISICLFTYTVAATYGYLTFGSNVSSDILKSYNANYPSVLIGNIALAVKTYVSTPVNNFCGREAVDDIWIDFKLSRRKADDPTPPAVVAEKGEMVRRIVIATVWFITSLILAVILPNISAVIKILGSLAALFIFVLPGLCLLRVSLIDTSEGGNSTKNAWLTLVAGGYLALGAFIFGCVLTEGILFDFVDKSEVEIPLCYPNIIE